MSDEGPVAGEAGVLTTISDEGFPHHCFLSEDEWCELGSGMRVSLLIASRTVRNLAARPRALMLRVIDGDAVLFRLEASREGTPMQADPRRASFEFRIVEKTVAKTPPQEKARLTGSLSFEREESREESNRRRRVKEELCH